MVAVTSVTQYNVLPFIDKKMVVVTYTKANAGDTLDMSTYGINTVLYATAKKTSTGADDPCTWSSATITFTTGTAAGAALVVGSS